MASARVHELARELGVEGRVVLAALRGLGFSVMSMSSRVEAPVVSRLYEMFAEQDRRSHGTQEAPKHRGEPRQQLLAEPATIEQRAEAAETFGLQLGQIQMRRLAPPDRRRHRARFHPIDEWSARLMDSAEKRRWIEAGLGEHDARIADDCRMYGLTPDDLAVRVDGDTIGARLGGGESVGSVCARIAEWKRRQSDAG